MRMRGVLRRSVRMAALLVLMSKKLVGILSELCQAVLTAKMIGLPVVLVFSSSAWRIHVHAADRIDDGFNFPAGLVDRGSMRGRGGFHESLRVFLELRHAVLAAEVIRLSVIFVFSGSVFWIDGHAADWVGGHTDLLVVILTLSLADARPAIRLHRQFG
jgi:hypothetical protein